MSKRRSPSKKVMQAITAAHQAGIQKGAQATQMAMAQAAQAAPKPPMGPPPAPPPGAGAPPPQGMKKGGSVWAKKWGGKTKKMAMGGSVRGGRGDGCCVKGKTKGRMC